MILNYITFINKLIRNHKLMDIFRERNTICLYLDEIIAIMIHIAICLYFIVTSIKYSVFFNSFTSLTYGLAIFYNFLLNIFFAHKIINGINYNANLMFTLSFINFQLFLFCVFSIWLIPDKDQSAVFHN